jgi:hypothetical protein
MSAPFNQHERDPTASQWLRIPPCWASLQRRSAGADVAVRQIPRELILAVMCGVGTKVPTEREQSI